MTRLWLTSDFEDHLFDIEGQFNQFLVPDAMDAIPAIPHDIVLESLANDQGLVFTHCDFAPHRRHPELVLWALGARQEVLSVEPSHHRI